MTSTARGSIQLALGGNPPVSWWLCAASLAACSIACFHFMVKGASRRRRVHPLASIGRGARIDAAVGHLVADFGPASALVVTLSSLVAGNSPHQNHRREKSLFQCPHSSSFPSVFATSTA